MATWTNIADTVLEPLKPIRSVDGLALRDNPIAIAEGAAGAPRIQNAAMDAGSVDNANVVNGTLGSEKFQTGTAERDWVLARTAGATQGVVGSYSFLQSQAGSVAENATAAGSGLRFSDTAVDTGSTPAGTWRNMGATILSGSQATLFLRIS